MGSLMTMVTCEVIEVTPVPDNTGFGPCVPKADSLSSVLTSDEVETSGQSTEFPFPSLIFQLYF